MSSDIAISAAALSKCYQIYKQPQDRLKQMVVTRLSRLLLRQPAVYYSEFWALRDVSLQLRRGEAVGVIGRNGSGKSTLLQMVCGTLTPTHGSVETTGKVAALLELGAGFNPEFTGRENVYLAAGLYGLTPREVDQRFDQIASFADIGEFIEQPVKTYSSGMYVRLAFSVVANVDADILVIDEALAVGDALFTQKCMRFIRRFRESGTLLFVSHDTVSVMALCDKAIWLHAGAVRAAGRASEVCKEYMQFNLQELYGHSINLEPVRTDSAPLPAAVESDAGRARDLHTNEESSAEFFGNADGSEGFQTGGASIQDVSMLDESSQPINTLAGGERVTLRVTASLNMDFDSPIIGFYVKDRLGQPLFGEHTYLYSPEPNAAKKGDVLEASFRFVLPMLPNGDYSVTVSIANGDPINHIHHHWVHDALLIKVASNRLRYGMVGIPFEAVRLSRVSTEIEGRR